MPLHVADATLGRHLVLLLSPKLNAPRMMVARSTCIMQSNPLSQFYTESEFGHMCDKWSRLQLTECYRLEVKDVYI